MKKSIKNKLMLCFTLAVVAALSSYALILAAAVTTSSDELKKSNIFIAGKNVISIEENTSLPSYSQIIGDVTSGVLISTKGNEASFSYNGLIDVKALNKNSDLIAFQAIASNEAAIGKRVEIRLTDSEDSSNRISIVYTPALSGSDPGFNSYARVLYNNVERGKDNMGKDAIHQNIYGTMGRMQSFYGHNVLISRGEKTANIFRAKFDNNEKAFYIFGTADNNLVLDLDNPEHVGFGKEWGGFESGLAKLEVFIEFEKDGQGGLIVTNLLGMDLNGTVTEANKLAPTIQIKVDEEYEKNMPPAAVNVPYKMPVAYAFDWYDGAKQATVKVFDSANQDITAQTVSGNNFTAKAVGTYHFEYSRVNSFGKTTADRLEIKVLNKIPNYYVGLAHDEKPVMLNYFEVPEISAMGGSGKLTAIEEYIFDSKQVFLDENRRFYISGPGIFRINVEVIGYTGEPYKKSFSYFIESDAGFFTVRNAPSAITKGIEMVLPDFEFYQENSAVAKKIFVDGAAINVNERKIKTNKQHGETVQVKYQTTYQNKVAEKVYNLTVIEPDKLSNFLIGENITSITTEQSYTKIDFNTNAKISFPYAVSTQDLGLRFNVASGSDFSSLDIKFTDTVYNEISYFIRLTPYNAVQSFVQINGKGQKHLMSGGFGGESFNFNIDNIAGMLMLGNGDAVCPLPILTGNGSKVDMAFNGVASSSSVNLVQVSNQMFTSIGFNRGDRTEPILSLSKNIADVTPVYIGEVFNIYKAVAYDVLSYNSEVTVEVIDPTGKTIYSGESANKSFPVEMKGFYTAFYTVKDSAGNSSVMEYNFRVIDIHPPAITLSGSLTDRVKAGVKFVVPNATVTDNFDDECELIVMLLNSISYERKVVQTGELIIAEKGLYKIIYYARDSAYNITRIEHELLVV